MPESESLEYLESEVAYQIASYDSSRKFYRNANFWISLSAAGLSAATTVLIGIGQTLDSNKFFAILSQRSIHCPFHKPDKRPSCRVELDKKVFHCFACEASGNVLEFVALLEGDPDDLRGAATKVADICEMALAPPRQGRKA